MRSDFKILLAAFVLLSSITLAISGSGTITVLDSGSATRTYAVTTDGSGHFVAKSVICDQAAAANCVGVDASNGIAVAGEGTAGTPAGGVVSVQGVSGGTAQPVSAASGSIASGAVASGAFASGSVASGAVASGAFASGSISDGAEVTQGAKADSAATDSTSSWSVIALLKGIWAKLSSIATNVAAQIPACTSNPCNNIGSVGQVSQYPAGATPLTASATGTTGATTATLAGTSGKTTYICGYSIRANATGATTVTDTITGVITATLSSILWVAPAASGIGVDEQIFSPCIPASGTNQAIAIVSGAPGSGGTVSSKGWGYQL